MNEADCSPPAVLFEPGFLCDPDVLLERLLEETPWDRRMRARLTASVGVPYNYSGMTYPEAPMPPDLARLCGAIEERLGFLPNNCLINYYPDGDAKMGFHSDSIDELEPGTGVAIVSLGATRVLRFCERGNRAHSHDFPLPTGSLLYMPPEVQLGWLHGVPPQAGAGARMSLTFRRLRGETPPDAATM